MIINDHTNEHYNQHSSRNERSSLLPSRRLPSDQLLIQKSQRSWFYLDDQPMKSSHNFCCGVDWSFIHRSWWYHMWVLLIHVLVVVSAFFSALLPIISSTTSSSNASYYFPFFATPYQNPISVLWFHFCFVVFTIMVDIYASFRYVQLRITGPYSLSSAILYFSEGIVCVPSCPSTLYVSDKLVVLCRGYLFAFLPYLNLISIIKHADQETIAQSVVATVGTTAQSSSTSTGAHWVTVLNSLFSSMPTWELFFRKCATYVLFIQIIATSYAWLVFTLFGLCFVYEIFFRTILWACCVCRPRYRYYSLHNNDDISFWTIPSSPDKYLGPSANSVPLQPSSTTQLLSNQQNVDLTNSQNSNNPSIPQYGALNSTLLDSTGDDVTTEYDVDVYCADNSDYIASTMQPQQDGAGAGNPLVSASSPSSSLISPPPDPLQQCQQTGIQTEHLPVLPARDSYFSSDISDPWFYRPYAILWMLM